MNDNKLRSSNMDDTNVDMNEEKIWFWNKSLNRLKSNLQYSSYSNKKGNLGPKRSRTEKKVFLQKKNQKDKIEQDGKKTYAKYINKAWLQLFITKKKTTKI